MDDPHSWSAWLRREWKWWALPPILLLVAVALLLWFGRDSQGEPFMYLFF